MDLELLCCEGTLSEPKAYSDRVLLSQRVLDNLLKTEDGYFFPGTFLNNQKDITAHMRKIVAEWMMEVRFLENCSF